MSHMIWQTRPYQEGLEPISPEQLELNKAARREKLERLDKPLNRLELNARFVQGSTQRERKKVISDL